MKKYILFIFLFTIYSVVNAQKTTVDDDIIKVDDKDYAKIQKSKGLSVDFTLFNLNGEELIFFKFCEFNNPNKISSSNPKGRVTYYEVTFLKSGAKCEIECNSTKKAIAKKTVENKLIEENAINSDAEKNFILKNGSKFTEEKKAIEGPKVIIIER